MTLAATRETEDQEAPEQQTLDQQIAALERSISELHPRSIDHQRLKRRLFQLRREKTLIEERGGRTPHNHMALGGSQFDMAGSLSELEGGDDE